MVEVLLRRAGGSLQAAAEENFWNQEAGEELEETSNKGRNVRNKREEDPSSPRSRTKKTTVFDLDALSDSSRDGLLLGVFYVVGELTSPKEDEIRLMASEMPSAIAAAVAGGVKAQEGRLLFPSAG